MPRGVRRAHARPMTPARTNLPSITPLASVLRWLAPAAVLVGWLVVAAGTLYSTAVRENRNSCGAPADLPSNAGIFLGGLAMVLAGLGFGMAMWLRTRDDWAPATAVEVACIVLGLAGALLAVWVAGAHFAICF